MSSGELDLCPAAEAPGRHDLDRHHHPELRAFWVTEVLKYRKWILLALVILLLLVVVIAGVVGGLSAAIAAAVVAVGIGVAVWSRLKTISQQATILNDFNPANMTPQTVAAAPPSPGFSVTAAGAAPAAGPTSGADSTQAAAFRTATSDLFTGLLEVPLDPAARSSARACHSEDDVDDAARSADDRATPRYLRCLRSAVTPDLEAARCAGADHGGTDLPAADVRTPARPLARLRAARR